MINNVHARKPLRRSVSADCDTKVWTQKKAVKKFFIAVEFLGVLRRVLLFSGIFSGKKPVFREFSGVFPGVFIYLAYFQPLAQFSDSLYTFFLLQEHCSHSTLSQTLQNSMQPFVATRHAQANADD